jgi:hypothetical protein
MFQLVTAIQRERQTRFVTRETGSAFARKDLEDPDVTAVNQVSYLLPFIRPK